MRSATDRRARSSSRHRLRAAAAPWSRRGADDRVRLARRAVDDEIRPAKRRTEVRVALLTTAAESRGRLEGWTARHRRSRARRALAGASSSRAGLDRRRPRSTRFDPSCPPRPGAVALCRRRRRATAPHGVIAEPVRPRRSSRRSSPPRRAGGTPEHAAARSETAAAAWSPPPAPRVVRRRGPKTTPASGRPACSTGARVRETLTALGPSTGRRAAPARTRAAAAVGRRCRSSCARSAILGSQNKALPRPPLPA